MEQQLATHLAVGRIPMTRRKVVMPPDPVIEVPSRGGELGSAGAGIFP